MCRYTKLTISIMKKFKYRDDKVNVKEVIILVTKFTYKVTGFVILIVGALFFLRDLGVNYIGNTSGWTIIIVLVGTGLLAGDFQLNRMKAAAAKKK